MTLGGSTSAASWLNIIALVRHHDFDHWISNCQLTKLIRFTVPYSIQVVVCNIHRWFASNKTKNKKQVLPDQSIVETEHQLSRHLVRQNMSHRWVRPASCCPEPLSLLAMSVSNAFWDSNLSKTRIRGKIKLALFITFHDSEFRTLLGIWRTLWIANPNSVNKAFLRDQLKFLLSTLNDDVI